jgi:hypothetical protein
MVVERCLVGLIFVAAAVCVMVLAGCTHLLGDDF